MSSPGKRRVISSSEQPALAQPTATSNHTNSTHASASPQAKKRRVSDLNQDLTKDELDYIISGLSLPDRKIPVALDYANNRTVNAQVQAYAKLAGQNWTYYVRTLSVVIGRGADDNEVQIDLGPAKVISRKHATIQYNGEYWELEVSGRNGVKIDRVVFKEGSKRLYSGNVLEIGGVQMMFVLPDSKPNVAPVYRQRLYNMPQFPPQTGNSLLQSNLDPFSQDLPGAPPIYHQNPPPAQNQSSHRFVQYQKYDSSYAPSYENIPAGYSSQFDSQQPLPAQQQQRTSYPKGVAIISQSQVRSQGTVGHYLEQDLSSEDAKDIKPPYSYATIISQAILSTEEHMMTLADIYDWISRHYSFYRFSKSGWQNSIRHNLSLNKAFEKVPRRANEPGKGMKWQIVAQFKEEFQLKAQQGEHIKGKSTIAQMQRQAQQRYSPQRASSSNPLVKSEKNTSLPPLHVATTDEMEAAAVVATLATSPTRNLPRSPQVKREEKDLISTPHKQSMWDGHAYSDQYGFTSSISDNPGQLNLSTPSPTHRYQPGHQISQLEAYTPERGSSNGRLQSWRHNSASKESTPLNKLISLDARQREISASNGTTVSNTTEPGDDTDSNESDERGPGPLVGLPSTTPASKFQANLQLAAPSSAQQQQLPSSFMPNSSPAPFWRFMQGTPVRGGNDFSPTKFSSPTAAVTLTQVPASRSSKQSTESNSSGSSGPGFNKSEALGDLQNVDLTR